MDDLSLYEKSRDFGREIDFVLHSIGMSPMSGRKHYTGLNYEWYKQTLDVSAMSLHKTLQVAKEMDALTNGDLLSLNIHCSSKNFSGL